MISALVLLLFYLMMVLIISPSIYGLLLLQPGSPNKHLDSANTSTSTSTQKSEQATLIHRKLLVHGRCTNRDISISQSRDSSTSGIPKYIVEIVNTCVSGCAPSNIHLHCGWFASARIVNPRVFKRLGYDDCLVKAGRPLNTSQIIRFTYSNSFMYPLGFKYAKFC